MSTDLFRLDGQRALVTGSTQGLGHALARGLARAGAHVIINGRNPEKTDAVVETLLRDGFSATGYAFDVTRETEVVEGVRRIESDEVGPIEILVNNVGVHRRAPLQDMTNEMWDTVIHANLTSAFTVSREVARGMLQRERGKIINVCSLMSDLGRPTTGNYAAAKGGLRMLTRVMAVEWAASNLQINAIGPGYFATEMTRDLVDDEAFNTWICARTPAGRWGKPEELVGTAIYLASGASSFVNGQILYVDGGLTAAI